MASGTNPRLSVNEVVKILHRLQIKKVAILISLKQVRNIYLTSALSYKTNNNNTGAVHRQ